MNIEGWKYYNHATIPSCPPHEMPDLRPIQDGSIWKLDGYPFLAQWTTDWDCGYETNWWYVIKDTPFDSNALKAKRRYEITKGRRNFDIKIIAPENYIEDIYSVTVAAYSGWPSKYRPKIEQGTIEKSVKNWKTVFAAFYDEKILQGYAVVDEHDVYANFLILRTNPNMEKLGVNAALVNGILEYYNHKLKTDFFYICDGSRSIKHETAFQDYLEKYFGFRKAYCKLHIKYRRCVGIVMQLLYPFRKLLQGKTQLTSNLKAILKMEELKNEYHFS